MSTAQLSQDQVLSAETRSAIEALTRQVVADEYPSGGPGNRDIGGSGRDPWTGIATPADRDAQRFFGFAAIAASLIANVAIPAAKKFLFKRNRDIGLPEPDPASWDRDVADLFSTLMPVVLSAVASTTTPDNRDFGPDVPVSVEDSGTGETDRGWGFFTKIFKKAVEVAAPIAIKLATGRGVEPGVGVDATVVERNLAELLEGLLPVLMEFAPSAPTADHQGGTTGRDVGPDQTPTGQPVSGADSTDRGWGWITSALKVAVPFAVKLITKRNVDRGVPSDPTSFERDLGDVLSGLLPALLAALPTGQPSPTAPTVPGGQPSQSSPVPVSGNGSGAW